MLLSELLWTIPIFSWAAGGQNPWCTMLLGLVWRVYEQNHSEWANGYGDSDTGQVHWSGPLVRSTGQVHWSGPLVRSTGQVSVRYLGSEFLGQTTAADLLTHFKDGIRQLDPNRSPTLLWHENAKHRNSPNFWTSAAEKSWKRFKLSWKSHGKVMELYDEISVGTLLIKHMSQCQFARFHKYGYNSFCAWTLIVLSYLLYIPQTAHSRANTGVV